MTDEEHKEEQEMEAEALAAIFDTSFEVLSSSPPLEWAVHLFPEGNDGDGDGENDSLNHVGIRLVAKIPLSYPDEGSPPDFKVEILKGLTEEHAASLKAMADEEATVNAGMPVLYAVCEKLKEWLHDNNEKGLDDRSAYAQMMAREKEKEREKQKAEQEYEAQKQKEVMTEAEEADLALRKRRAEGTPCTDETFYAWRDKFNAEMKEKESEDAAARAGESRKGGGGNEKKEVDKSGRLTGYQQFSDKTGTFNLDAIEAAAENAERDPDEEDDVDEEDLDGVDEELFDVDDDDLDDLDFDDDDDDEEDDEQPDI